MNVSKIPYTQNRMELGFFNDDKYPSWHGRCLELIKLEQHITIFVHLHPCVPRIQRWGWWGCYRHHDRRYAPATAAHSLQHDKTQHVDMEFWQCVKPIHADFYSFFPFLPEASFGYSFVLACAVCVSVWVGVSLCVNHLFVLAITQDPFKLGSPNLDQRCKTTWLRSLLFGRAIDLDLQGQI